MIKRNNSVIVTKDERFFEIINIIRVETNSNRSRYVIIERQYEPLIDVLCKINRFSLSTYATVVSRTINVGAFFLKKLIENVL